jgi:hypothetical protein
MPELVAGIGRAATKDVDGRDEPGHDGTSGFVLKRGTLIDASVVRSAVDPDGRPASKLVKSAADPDAALD